jgi:hypothetical protein
MVLIDDARVDTLGMRDSCHRLGDLLQFQQDDLVRNIQTLVVDSLGQQSLGLWRLVAINLLEKFVQVGVQFAGRLRQQCLEVFNLTVDIDEARVGLG